MTAHEIDAVPRPGLRATGALVRAEMRMVTRDTAGLIVPIALPVLVLVMNGSGTSAEIVGPGTITAFDRFVLPLALTMIIAVVGIVNMPSFLALYRKSGVLKRLSTTPIRPTQVLAAQVITSVVQATLGIGIALSTAALLFGITPPHNPILVATVLVLGAAAMYSLGIVVAAIAPTANSAVAIGLTLFLVLGAVGGLFGPVADLPGPVAAIGEVLPFGATVSALGSAWAGTPVDIGGPIGLVVAVIAGTACAIRLFRWS
ncbi:ABC transporter permease [Rhodococcus cercidiphylli]|jgi:ABC-2 type transport system permease protein|uniref:Transport permease protein n=1 Tax=Rhodococcus cercidiphylli TaxID=489916 RepID=A0ABU4AS24_9NOCA|nr:ABC transporter permease [Rhodococcus cercidiphylli]MDV6229047.1 ABC transporter permease [Rhodococcus cercidiphylli]